MANRPATITQTELTGYAKAMRDAGIAAWSVVAERPDGSRLIITAGEQTTGGNGGEIDKMLGIDR